MLLVFVSMHALLLAISNQVGGTGSGFFLAHKDFRGRFDVSFLTCAPPPPSKWRSVHAQPFNFF